MTDTPTRAEVEALLLKWVPTPANPICDCSGQFVCAQHELTNALTALLPLAYTPEGETWRAMAAKLSEQDDPTFTWAFKKRAEDDYSGPCYFAMLAASPAAPDLAAEVLRLEEENTRLRKALRPFIERLSSDTPEPLAAHIREGRSALSPQEPGRR